MKKILFLAAVSAIAMTSCVNEESDLANPQKQVLKFDAPVLSQTRANVNGEISGIKYPETEHFKVYCKAYKGGFKGWNASDNVSDYFDANGEVAKSGLAVGAGKYWATDIVHYWPEVDYNLAFAAYSPAEFSSAPSAVVSHTEKGLQIKNFVTAANSDEQFDLMYTLRKYDLNKVAYANAAVPLAFQHALSSIVFSSQKSSSDVNYKITKIEVKGLFCEQADFNQNVTESYTAGVYSETEAPVWENKVAASGVVTYTPGFTEFSVPVEAPAQFTSGESALLLIPQDVPAEATVTVYYTKITNPGLPSEKTLETSATIKLKDFCYNNDGTNHYVNTWERGKRYVYRIAFGQNTRIYFEPSITDWVQEPTLVYTIQ
ncbi:MAG: fimbrillin family protein [Bacteroidaceae bacterium]|nr:fimbrillin family protein [Bacteroidaceae bacterium]